VPGVRDLLDRFRPAGAPGAATAAGVPADRRAVAATELEPVFEALAPVIAECDAVRVAASAAADREGVEAAEHARAVVSRARNEADAERAATAARLREHAAAEGQRLAARAATEADRVRRRADRRRPELLARVVDRVRAELSAFNGGGP
jgi:hypothetical protein